MERLFGEYLIKCKVLPKPEAEAAAEENKDEAADPDMPIEEAPFYPYEKISVDDALVRTQTAHIAVLFTAEYCPPCHGFM